MGATPGIEVISGNGTTPGRGVAPGSAEVEFGKTGIVGLPIKEMKKRDDSSRWFKQMIKQMIQNLKKIIKNVVPK